MTRRKGVALACRKSFLKRKSPKLAAVALANKTARIAWKMMVTGENYARKSCPRRVGPALLEEISQSTGSTSTATVLSRCRNLQDDEQMV